MKGRHKDSHHQRSQNQPAKSPPHEMSVRPVLAAKTVIQNGVGAFVKPCHEIVFRYCDFGGSSRGMREFLRKQLPRIANENPDIKFVVKREPGHPLVVGHYAGGLKKPICVRNYEPSKILEKVNVAKNASGNRLTKFTQAVRSDKTSVRGIWSPFHTDKEFRHRI